MKTRDKELAVQAGWIKEAGEPDAGCLNLERFAELVRADEREACAKMCEEQYEYYGHDHVFAAAIRARGNK